MLTRIISGVVGIGLFVGLCFAGLAPFALAATAIGAIAAAEFARAEMLASPVLSMPAWAVGIAKLVRVLNPLFVCLGVTLIPLAFSLAKRAEPRVLEGYAIIVAAWVLTGIVLVVRAWRSGQILGWFRAFYGKVGFWYIGATVSCFVLLRAIPGRVRVGRFPVWDRGAWLMMLCAVCVWAADSSAYFVGRAVGRHKFCEALSPKKTVEGFAGGVAGAIIVGALFGAWIGLGVPDGLVVGAIVGVVGPLGDLFESGLKREIGIKDFGSIMPGHGGVLDRFDSLMFAAPVVYMYLLCTAR